MPGHYLFSFLADSRLWTMTSGAMEMCVWQAAERGGGAQQSLRQSAGGRRRPHCSAAPRVALAPCTLRGAAYFQPHRLRWLCVSGYDWLCVSGYVCPCPAGASQSAELSNSVVPPKHAVHLPGQVPVALPLPLCPLLSWEERPGHLQSPRCWSSPCLAPGASNLPGQRLWPEAQA